ncbi:MAG TPA: DUF3185 family protein [Geopsychrobacteraceae bacterium]|nr:DUF3185 family protein [Geopsychrobacteraceae bacterium]
MAKRPNTNKKLIGLILIVIGIGVAIWGYQMSESVASQLTRAISGSDTDKVMVCYIGGAASFVAGLFLVAKK